MNLRFFLENESLLAQKMGVLNCLIIETIAYFALDTTRDDCNLKCNVM